MAGTSDISRTKRVVFSLVPAGLLLLILVMAEIVLRATAPDPRQPLYRQVRYDGIDWIEINRGFLAPYFPVNSPSIPEFKPSLLRSAKRGNGFRVICLGSSSMFGTPYDMNGNIPGILRKQLRKALPEREVEVLNLGASAINSNVIRDFAPLLPALQPDAVVIYMGHNEFYGPDGVGASWVERKLGFPTEWKYELRKLRLFQLAAKLLASSPPAAGIAEANLMKQVSEGQSVSLASSDARRVFVGFEENLRKIVATFRERGIPVFVGELSSSMLFPPFVSDSLRSGSASASLFASIKKNFLAGEHQRVLETAGSAAPADSMNAYLSYWSGRSALALGDTDRARELLDRARDNDLLKFRAPSPINGIIRRVCGETGTPCIPVDSLFRAQSRGGITGESLFWEHLHPTLEGYYAIAGAFQERMANTGLIPPFSPLPFNRDSLAICWFEEAYADLSIQHLTGRWPFEEYRRAPAVIGGTPSPLLGVVVETYNRSITWNEGCYKSATYFWSSGDHHRARLTYQAMLDEYPWSFYTNYLMGTLCNVNGERDRAAGYYRNSIAANPSYSRARIDLGLLEVGRGNLDAAIGLLSDALPQVQGAENRELRSVVFYGLAAAFADKGERTKALASLEESLRAAPGNRNAITLKGAILRRGG